MGIDMKMANKIRQNILEMEKFFFTLALTSLSNNFFKLKYGHPREVCFFNSL